MGDIGQIRLPQLTGATAPTILTFGYNGARQVNAFSNTDSTHGYGLTYAFNGLPQSLTDPLTHSWGMNWQGADLVNASDPRGALFTLNYGNTNLPHFPTSVVDAGNHTWTISPFASGPNIYGQVSQIVPPPNTQQAINFSYWGSGNAGVSGLLSYSIDGNGNRVDVNNYDLLGDLTSWTTYPGTQNGSPAVENFGMAYDLAQRPTTFYQPDNRTFNWNYYSTALGRYTRNLDHTVDEGGRQVNYTFCPVCGALEAVSCGAWGLSWQDDGDGDLSSFTNALGFRTLYDYGSAQELTTITYPDDTPTHNDNLQLLYDKYGRVRQLTDPRSNVFTLEYDNADNLTHVGGATTIWLSPLSDNSLYSATNDVGTTTIIPDGVTRQPARIVYNYTGAGLANVQQLDYVYNPDGSRQSLTWHNGTALVGVWNYAYDAGGRLLTVTNPYNETTRWWYEGDDKLDWQQNANGTWNGLEYAGNGGRDWPTQALNFSNAGGLGYFGNYLLTYDNLANGAGTVGNLTGVTEADGSTVAYGYDFLYRLTGEVRTGTHPYTQQNYTYDLAGNRTRLNGTTYSYNPADIPAVSSGFSSTTSDLDGNLLTLSGPGLTAQNITWNAVGQATVFKNLYGTVLANAGYDPFGRRVWTQPPGLNPTFFIYDGDMLLGEVQVWSPTSIPVTTTYTWGAAGLISEHTYYPGKSLWYHYGPQGETRQLTNTAGLIADTYTYGAYGVPVVGGTTGTDPNPFRFGGQVGYYTANSTGLIRCGARWYDPEIGRFISRDPVGYGGGPNLFEYCGGDPVNSIDPLGLDRSGNIFQYIFSRDYVSDVGDFFGGEVSTLNPVSMVKGLYGAGRHIYEDGWEGAGDVASGFWNGLQFWNKDNLHDAGASFFGDVLLAAPLIKKIPNFTPINITGPYGNGLSNCTLFAVSRGGRNIFRADIGVLPNKSTIPPLLRGRTFPHYHRLGELGPDGNPLPGHGISKHRPFQGGPGPRF